MLAARFVPVVFLVFTSTPKMEATAKFTVVGGDHETIKNAVTNIVTINLRYGNSSFLFLIITITTPGSLVVKELCYKPEGSGFKTR
jgi:hypothetical protein